MVYDPGGNTQCLRMRRARNDRLVSYSINEERGGGREGREKEGGGKGIFGGGVLSTYS